MNESEKYSRDEVAGILGDEFTKALECLHSINSGYKSKLVSLEFGEEDPDDADQTTN